MSDQVLSGSALAVLADDLRRPAECGDIGVRIGEVDVVRAAHAHRSVVGEQAFRRGRGRVDVGAGGEHSREEVQLALWWRPVGHQARRRIEERGLCGVRRCCLLRCEIEKLE